MNLKLISIYTIISLVLGTAASIPFGLWIGHDESITESSLYHILSYGLSFVVSLALYYSLFKFKMDRPVLHAVTVGVLSGALAGLIVYLLVGITTPILLLHVDILLMFAAIYMALNLCKIRGQFGVRA